MIILHSNNSSYKNILLYAQFVKHTLSFFLRFVWTYVQIHSVDMRNAYTFDCVETFETVKTRFTVDTVDTLDRLVLIDRIHTPSEFKNKRQLNSSVGIELVVSLGNSINGCYQGYGFIKNGILLFKATSYTTQS